MCDPAMVAAHAIMAKALNNYLNQIKELTHYTIPSTDYMGICLSPSGCVLLDTLKVPFHDQRVHLSNA